MQAGGALHRIAYVHDNMYTALVGGGVHMEWDDGGDGYKDGIRSRYTDAATPHCHVYDQGRALKLQFNTIWNWTLILNSILYGNSKVI